MVIQVNGTNQEIPEGMTVQRLLELFELAKKSVVFELNRKVVDRNQYAQTKLTEGDRLEIVHFVGGG